MTAYAHSLPGRPESEWEPVPTHLIAVEAGARQRGARFAAGDIAGAGGILHDLGKYTLDFLARLRGQIARVDHSSAGAAWVLTRFPTIWGRLLAHVIAGHHGGLGDNLFGQGGRLDGKSGLADTVEQLARNDGLALPVKISGPTGMRKEPKEAGFQLAFLTRMIFSCLIDADRMAASAISGGTADGAAVTYPSIAALEAALDESLRRLSAVAKPLNALRERVRKAVVAKAQEPQGIFTLTVPTGGGKTLASLSFALAHAREKDLDRVVVVIPYTSIIEQTAKVYRSALGSLGGAVLEHHCAFEMTDELARSRGCRTKQEHVGPDRLRLAMERWDSPIVVTTAVQFFESLFSDRPSRCRKLHSLARSVVVVDEAQTMPLPLLRPCVAALKELARNYGCSVVLSTATQPALEEAPCEGRGFKGGFTATRELAPNVPDLFSSLRRVTVRHIGVQDDAAIARLIGEKQHTLCIVNQRAHARALFKAIRHLPGARHISGCMHSVHRSRVLAEIAADLEMGRPCRVIATSLVEAGVDLDFSRVLRASGGLDQVAQGAGRCNREFRRNADESEVLVFTPADYPVMRSLRANAEAGDAALRQHADDPLSPAAMRTYFDMLYWRKGHAELDQNGVLRMCAERAADLNFPFAQIASAMRFIEDTMVPVIVQEEAGGSTAVEDAIQELMASDRAGGPARRLGRYSVGVPRTVRAVMIEQGAAEVIRPDVFGDQFVILRNPDLYTAETGLDWSNPIYLVAGKRQVS